jgi:hypothetical protein
MGSPFQSEHQEVNDQNNLSDSADGFHHRPASASADFPHFELPRPRGFSKTDPGGGTSLFLGFLFLGFGGFLFGFFVFLFVVCKNAVPTRGELLGGTGVDGVSCHDDAPRDELVT